MEFNEFKMGHQVIAWNSLTTKPMRGTYLYRNDRLHAVYVDYGPLGKITLWYANVKLDPDATEFVTGDKVEFSSNKKVWYNGIYGHFNNLIEFSSTRTNHLSMAGGLWRYCRYPKPELTKKEKAIKIIEIIDNFVSEAVDCMEIPDKEDIEYVYNRIEVIYNE